MNQHRILQIYFLHVKRDLLDMFSAVCALLHFVYLFYLCIQNIELIMW